jgi:hypothetical protein
MSANRRFRNGVSFGGRYTLTLSDKGEHRTDGAAGASDHNTDGSFVIRADQATFDNLMSNPGLQRPSSRRTSCGTTARPEARLETGKRVAAAVVNDWQVSGIFTAGSGAMQYDVSYTYQNNGANVNCPGSPDHAARVSHQRHSTRASGVARVTDFKASRPPPSPGRFREA